MRKNFLTTLGAGLLTGSFLVMAAGTAQAADQYPQGSGSQYPQGSSGQYQQGTGQSSQGMGQYQQGSDQQYRDNSGDRPMGTNNRDMYDSRDPTAAGAQGPMRNDMDRNMDGTTTYGAPSSYDSSSRYNSTSMYGSSSAMWDDLHRRMGPIGGEGTN